MNIYDFFNSPDVAEYCQSIGHTFNAVESAVMVSQSNSRTLAEKHAAYRTIISEYPDMEITEALNHGHIKSFHKALGDIITYEEQVLEKILMPEPGAVYQASCRYESKDESYDGEPYTTYEKALTDALDHNRSNEEYDLKYPYISIRKKIIDSKKYASVSANVSRSGEIVRIEDYDVVLPIPRTGELCLLDCCYIDVPVPFKRGDLVESYGVVGDVSVIKDICRDEPKLHNNLLKVGDLSDMTASVYYYESNGLIRCDYMHFYPNLQYCRRELEGETRLLKYVSLYMQDKLCLCSLLKIQKFLSVDKTLNELKKSYDLEYQLKQINDKLLE